jgi:RNA polymerase sigma-70 factor (ECF subfamily)
MTDREFEQFFREQFKALSNLAYSVLKDKDEAQDTVQHVFVNFWQKRNELQVRGTLKSYFYKSVLNASISRYKQHKRLTRMEDAPVLFASETNDQSHTEQINRQLHKAISELPPVCEQVFRLSRFSDLSNKEIAEELNISVKAVEKHITRALKTLRKTLYPFKQHYIEALVIQLFILEMCKEVGFLVNHLSS